MNTIFIRFGSCTKSIRRRERQRLFEDARNSSRSGSRVLALMDGEDADVPLLPFSSGMREPTEWPGVGVAGRFRSTPAEPKNPYLHENNSFRSSVRPAGRLNNTIWGHMPDV